MSRLAAAIAARGRWSLIAGLCIGLGWPAAAEAMRPAVGPLVIALLFLAMLRIGPGGLRIGRRGLGRVVTLVALLQCALPVALALALGALGLLHGDFALGALLILAAAPITGAAHIAVMSGGDPTPALRLTVIGTALLPLTVVPVFALAPAFGDASDVIAAVLRLLVVILAAGGLALALHRLGIARRTDAEVTAIDAIAAILLGAVVIGLMSAAGETLRTAPGTFMGAMAFVCMISFGMQGVVAVTWRNKAEAPAFAVAGGCRNVALFLGVLPETVTDELLLLIGCYQVPMYLAPLMLPRFLALRRHRA
jgi:ACR3 family arsenite transporter